MCRERERKRESVCSFRERVRVCRERESVCVVLERKRGCVFVVLERKRECVEKERVCTYTRHVDTSTNDTVVNKRTTHALLFQQAAVFKITTVNSYLIS